MERLEFSDEVFRQVMPQKEPMLLCDGVLANDLSLNHQVGVYTVGARVAAPLTAKGELPAICLMEVMALTILAEAIVRSSGEEIAKARLTVLNPTPQELEHAVGAEAAKILLSK